MPINLKCHVLNIFENDDHFVTLQKKKCLKVGLVETCFRDALGVILIANDVIKIYLGRSFFYNRVVGHFVPNRTDFATDLGDVFDAFLISARRHY